MEKKLYMSSNHVVLVVWAQNANKSTTDKKNEHPIQQAHLTADIIENKQQPATNYTLLCVKKIE